MFSILTILKSSANFFRKNKLATALALLASSGFAAAIALHPDQDDRRNFIVCLSNESVRVECKMPLRVSVLKSAEQFHVAPPYLTSTDASFTVEFPSDERLIKYTSATESEAWVSFASESFATRYERYSQADPPPSLRGYAIHREMGSLVAIKETGDSDYGTEFLVPANGDQSVFIDCVKPFVALAGNLVTDTGCRVQTQLEPYVFVRYGFNRKYLQEWESINADVMNRVRSAMVVTTE